MKSLKNIFLLSMVALMGLSLTGCSNDDLDTNPYNKDGVNILGFGPSPILRTKEIRITGTSLGSVSAVEFPGGARVERAAFNSADGENIYVNVPDESLPGKIKLMSGDQVLATSTSLLTFEEPIEVTSIEPLTNLNAGDEITIKGDYVYNIAQVIFTCGASGAPVNAEDFTFTSRREIRLRVPLEAVAGTITLTNGDSWTQEWSTPAQINPATVTGISATSADFGQTITINGTNLHTVKTIMFPGAVEAEFTVADNHNSISAKVPAECKSGNITILFYSGESTKTEEFKVPEISVTAVSQDKDLKVGDVVTLTGVNFDRITKVTLPGIEGDFTAYTISGNTLTFTVPEDMTDGKMVLTQNSYISVEVKLAMFDESGEQAIWTGTFDCTGWSGNQDLAWGGFDWSTVAAGTKLRFYYKKNTAGAWACISLRHGDSWGNLPDPIPGQYDLTDDEGVLEVIFTQDVLDDLIAHNGLVITGDNYTLSKVTIPSAENAIWTGSFVCTGWSGNQDLAWGGFDWSTVAAGAKLKFYYKKNTAGAWACISLRHGNSWGNLPDPIPGQYDLTDDEGVLEVVFTQSVLDDLMANNGLVITGDNYTLSKVTLQ